MIPSTSWAFIDDDLKMLRKSFVRMGTLVNITILHRSLEKAERCIESAIAKMDHLIAIFDNHSSTTAIGELNKRGTLLHSPSELLHLLDCSDYFYHISNGLFDPTIRPLLQLFKDRFRESGAPPSQEEIREILSYIGWKRVKRDGEAIFLGDSTTITLDGIAKGYIVDRVIEHLKGLGVRHALLDAGGDIRALGRKGRRGWLVAIQDPINPGSIVDIVTLRDNSVATSGNYEVYFDKNHIYHHIINPYYGRSPVDTISATVIAKSAMISDALATTLLIASISNAAYIRREFTGKMDYMIINRRGRVYRSGGWLRYSQS